MERDKPTLLPAANVPTPRPRRTSAKSAKASNDKRGQSRRESILLAAERLFAQRGYHAVSIRDVAAQAGVPSALVGYYFGQKHELFLAIFEHWSATRSERLGALAEALSQAPGATDELRLTAIVEAFVQPVLRLRASEEGEYYAMLVGRELSFNHPDVDGVLRQHFDPLADAFIDALGQVFARANKGQLAWCYQFALGALLHHLTDRRVERLSDFQNRLGDPVAQKMLVEFLVGGIARALA